MTPANLEIAALISDLLFILLDWSNFLSLTCLDLLFYSLRFRITINFFCSKKKELLLIFKNIYIRKLHRDSLLKWPT